MRETPVNIREIQARLKALGYDPGPIDGVPGRLTAAAVARFQADQRLDVKFPGSIGPMTIAALNAASKGAPTMPTVQIVPWYEEARRHFGLREIRGPKHHPTIVRWLEFLKAPFRDDETAWCGTFVGWCLGSTLPAEPLPKNPFGARQWLGFGDALREPSLGAVLVFWRGSPAGWQGHVGFYAGERSDAFRVLGGNQSDSVSETWIAKSRLLGIRWPKTYDRPIGGRVYSNAGGGLSTNEA